MGNIASIITGLALSFSPLSADAAATPVALADWQPQAGDTMIVDTAINEGYLVHTDGSFTSFLVATGQRRTISYIGRTYYAATPKKRMEVATLSLLRRGRG